MAARADGLLPRRALLVLFQKIGRNRIGTGIGTGAGTEVWDPGSGLPGSGIWDPGSDGILWNLVGSDRFWWILMDPGGF